MTVAKKSAAKAKSPTKARHAATARRAVTVKRAAAQSLMRNRTDFVVQILGSNTQVAELLDVNRSQPSRWRSGAEQPSPKKARELIDLDHVLARAMLIWAPEVAIDWLVGSNSYLDGARPLDVLRTRGTAEVLEALEAAASGAFG